MNQIKTNSLKLLLLSGRISGGLQFCKENVRPSHRATIILIRTNRICDIGRASIIELDNLSQRPEVSIDMTQALFEAIQKRNVFGLTVVYRSEPACKGLLIEGNEELRSRTTGDASQKLKDRRRTYRRGNTISSVPQACHRPSAQADRSSGWHTDLGYRTILGQY